MFYCCNGYKNIARHKKTLQSRFFVCLKYKKFFKLVERKFHFPKYKKRFTFRVLKVTFWNVRSFWGFHFLKQNKSFRGLRFLKYKKFSAGGFLSFFGLGLKSAGFHFWKYKKCLLLRKYKDFFNIRARKVYFQKYMEFFSRWFFLKYFFGLGW